MKRLCLELCLVALCCSSCGAIDPSVDFDYAPSQLEIGPLAMGTWLPAGMNEFRFTAVDRDRLAALGLNMVQWVQRYEDEQGTAEAQLMDFANELGWQMPVYYEAKGFSPYDKLHNWARRRPKSVDADSLQLLAASLGVQWREAPAFFGYLVGHEDYKSTYYPALAAVVKALATADPMRPALSVGRLQDYEDTSVFLAAFFDGGGSANIFQQEHYVFRGDLPQRGGRFQRRVEDLIDGYDQVARGLEGRSGRWHAIVQVQSEERDDRVYYRKPTAAEIRLQAGLALTRGAGGIVYFLYSSGIEELRDGEGNTVETRVYEGLVDVRGMPTPSYRAVKELNADLKELSTVLATRHFHGALSSRFLLDNELLQAADDDLEFGLFGDGVALTHMLVVNRRAHAARRVHLQMRGGAVTDALTGALLSLGEGSVELDIGAGAFRLLHIAEKGE
ncbi:MAG: hypothetical protein ACI906_002696 [Candidatus Latescibacterota bacterium]|jgi:hypothetical protein